MLVFRDGSDAGLLAGFAIEDHFDKLFILDTKAVGQLLARELELGADYHTTHVDKNSPEGHFFFAPEDLGFAVDFALEAVSALGEAETGFSVSAAA